MDSATAPVVTVTVSLATGPRSMPLRTLLSFADKQAMSAKLDGGRNRVHLTEVQGSDEASNAVAERAMRHTATGAPTP